MNTDTMINAPCRLLASAAIVITLAACTGQEGDVPDLSRYHSKGTPDEFAVVVYERIDIPAKGDELPTPGTVGTRVLQRPEAKATIALGGRDTNRRDGETPSGDATLTTYMASLGTRDDIRQVIAQEDLELRKANPGRYLEKVFGSNIYYRVYEDMTLDAYEETDRLAGLGYRVLQPPPEDPG